MELVVDLQAVRLALADPEDLGRFSVRVGVPASASAAVPDDVHRLHDVLVSAHAGRLDDDGHALIEPESLRFYAAGQVDEGWEEAFAAMVAGAAAHGWVKDGLIRAHVTWPLDGG